MLTCSARARSRSRRPGPALAARLLIPFFSAVGGFLSAATPEPAPNFVLILVDDQGWNGTSVPMLPGDAATRTPEFRMPNLDRLAARGIVFSQAYAAHPKCECSRAALQMGRSTTTLNATDKWARSWNAPASESLVNVLKRANPAYRAAHFGKWQWPSPPGEFGYDASDGVTQNEEGSSRDPDDPKLTFSLTRRAAGFIEKQVEAGRPFFLQVSYYAPHSPPQALASTLRKYSAVPSAPAKGGGKGQRGGGAIMAAMTEDLDTGMGALLRRIEELGVAGRTYVIYMSDNGMGSPGLKGAKALVDEGGIRVPLIVAGPGIPGGVYSFAPVIGYDLMPTVIDLAAPGFALPAGVEGGSWKPVLINGGAGGVTRPVNRLVWHHDVEVDHPQTALREGDLKLVHHWDTRRSYLYDLAKDPGERNDLAAKRPDDTARLLTALKAHVRSGLGERKFAALESGKPEASGRRGEKGKGKGQGAPR